jgi:hypothetical protein
MSALPPLKAHGVEIPTLEDLRKEIRENLRALRLAESQLPQREQGVERARVEDTQASIRARREGKSDPRPKNEEKAQAALDKARREIAVLQGLDTQLTTEAQEILAKHAAEITARLQATLTEANNTQLAALDAVEAARAERLQLSTVLAQVAAVAPPQAEAQGEAGDYVEVLVHHDADSVFRVGEDQVQKVLAFLRGESGDSGPRDQLAAMENPPADVVDFGTSLPVAAGKVYFEQRRAERAASSGT